MLDSDTQQVLTEGGAECSLSLAPFFPATDTHTQTGPVAKHPTSAFLLLYHVSVSFVGSFMLLYCCCVRRK